MNLRLPPSCRALLPSRSERAARLVALLIDAAARLDGPAKAAWRAAIDDLYGDLSGQRALERDPAVRRYLAGNRRAALPDLIIALHTYYALLCDGLTLGAAGALRDIAARPSGSFLHALYELATGESFQRLGIQPAGHPLPVEWYVDGLSVEESALFRETLADLADALRDCPPAIDLPQRLHTGLMPKNLLHIMGEFYTPPWLTRLLLEDTGWQPTRSLVDPFAGSGVFLLAAVEQARRQGCAARDLLPMVYAVDRNPAAFVALRANLLLALARDPGGLPSAIRLPITCADSILSDPPAPPADVLVTNPPWVGWEYIPRPYRDRLTATWKHYGLFTARGRDAAFLKEDLSTLALVVAWDRFLKPGGASAVLLRPATMRSPLAARGVRRLSIFPDSTPLRLRQIRVFDAMRPFTGADASAAAWLLEKGGPTVFPVPVLQWRPKGMARPDSGDSLAQVREGVDEGKLAAVPSDPGDAASPWTIGDPQCLQITSVLLGSNPYKVRTGVFTGGANAVYYVERAGGLASLGTSRYRNVTAGARREAPRVECELEDELVHEVVRGRDLAFWKAEAEAGALLLCPHTAETRMRPIAPAVLRDRCPNVLAYLKAMRPTLDARRGFAGWEKAVREKTYYAIQRIGAYTFAPFKTAWRYIAADFVVAVIGPGRDGRPRLCNDKVMFLAFDSEAEAHFVCGLLSSDPVRWCVVSAMTGTQISTSAIRHLNLPTYDAADTTHAEIAGRCRQGHEGVGAGRADVAGHALDGINRAVGRLYGLTETQLLALRADLLRRRPTNRFI